MEETDQEIQAIETLYQEIASLDSTWIPLQSLPAETFPSEVRKPSLLTCHHQDDYHQDDHYQDDHYQDDGECYDLETPHSVSSLSRQSVSGARVTYLGILSHKQLREIFLAKLTNIPFARHDLTSRCLCIQRKESLVPAMKNVRLSSKVCFRKMFFVK